MNSLKSAINSSNNLFMTYNSYAKEYCIINTDMPNINNTNKCHEGNDKF